MGKKYVPMSKGKKTYRLFVDDIKGCHQLIRKLTPKIPKYEDNEIEFKMGSQTPVTIGSQEEELMFEPMEFFKDITN